MSSMLTTLLLADAVEKGGPGSGPQGGRAAKTAAKTATAHAAAMEEMAHGYTSIASVHEKAATAHRAAAKAHIAAGNAKMAAFHSAKATELKNTAASVRASLNPSNREHGGWAKGTPGYDSPRNYKTR